MTKEETVQHLNHLIATCRDGELGYLAAAGKIRNTQLESIFNDYAKQRTQFAQQLQAEVERLGGNPSGSGTLTAALHRGWIDLKSALSGSDGAAIVAACETGEDYAAAEFERVVNLDIPGQTRSVIEKQWQKIREAHSHMQRLKREGTSADFQKTE